MKIYFDLAKKCLKEVDTENQVIFTGDVLVSKLEVISSAPTTDYYVVVSAKLSNGRTIGPFLYDAGGVQTNSQCTKWTFTLSSANGFTLTKGIVNFYVWLVPVNANDLNKKCIGAVAVNVGEAYGFEDSYFVELDSESQDVIANMSAQIHQLQTLIQNVNIIEPNPTDEATQILDKIKIGSVTYRFRSDYNELTNQPIKNVTLGANTTINDLLQAVDYDETLGELNTSYLLKIKGIFSSPYDSKYLVGMSVRYYNNAVQNVILSQVNGNVVYSGTWSASDFDHTIYNPTSSTTYTFNEFLKYTSQSLTDVQKQQAQANIGVKDVIDAVNYNVGTDVMRPQVDEVNFADVDEVRINAGKTMLVDDNNEDEALLSSILGGLDDAIADLESGKAKKIVATINNTTYVMTISLYADAEGTVLLSTATVDLPLESIVTSATYYDSYTYGGTTYKKVIVLVLSTTSVPTIVPVGDLISGLQTEIAPSNKLDADLVDDSTSQHKFVSDEDKVHWNSKQNALTFDNTPTASSNNPVKSGGIKSYVDNSCNNAVATALELSKSNGSWVELIHNDLKNGSNVWHKGTDTYYSWGVSQYKWNKPTKSWETQTWNIASNSPFTLGKILGYKIFYVGGEVYCSTNNTDPTYMIHLNFTENNNYWHSVLATIEGTSTTVTFDGANVWTDGTDSYILIDGTYYKMTYNSQNFNLTLHECEFNNIPQYNNTPIQLIRSNIWHDVDGYTYLAYNGVIAQLSDTTWNSIYIDGLSMADGSRVWTDGANTFYSSGQTWILDKDNWGWIATNWIGGFDRVDGKEVWYDGDNAYCSTNLGEANTYMLVVNQQVDQSYNANSKNAQSGTAVAEAVAPKENTSNKVTSWGTPTNTQYPSAKLVKDSLDEIAQAHNEASTDITDTTLYKISGVADTLALPKKSQVEIVKIEGNSHKYNQLAKALNSADWTINANLTTSYSNGALTVTYSNSFNDYGSSIAEDLATISGHKYFLYVNIVSTTESVTFRFNTQLFGQYYPAGIIKDIMTADSNQTYFGFGLYGSPIASGTSYTIKNLQLFDLTAMGIDTTDVSVATAELLKRGIDVNTYNAYDSGSIKDADTTELESCGINIWDEEWEVGGMDADTGNFIPDNNSIRSKNYVEIKPSTTYYCKAPNTYSTGRVAYYDSNKTYLGQSNSGWDILPNNNTFTTPSNARYMRFKYGATTYNHDVCINVSNASINGNYYAYTHDSVNVGSDVLRSAGSVRDSKTADGSIVRKVGVVDLGSLNYEVATTNTSGIYRMLSTDLSNIIKNTSNTRIANIICKNYQSTTANNVYSKVVGIAVDGTSITIYDTNYNDVNSPLSFKTAMSGVYLYYELATPTTEQGTPFSSNALAVEMYGAEWQNGTIPLQVTKNYDISIKDQVLTNVEVDKKQSEQINALKKLLEPTLLWANSDPTSDFAASTVNISNLSNFKYLIFEYAQSSGGVNLTQKVERKDGSFKLFGVYFPNVIYYTRRTVTISSTSVAFADCYITETADANSQLIPIAIYGTDIL